MENRTLNEVLYLTIDLTGSKNFSGTYLIIKITFLQNIYLMQSINSVDFHELLSLIELCIVY